MATGYEPNIQGAIAALRDLMIANNVNLAREPYEPNYRGLVDAVIDLKEGFPTFAPAQVTFTATAFEAVTEGDALFMRTSDGKVGKASAANGLLENASVIGFAQISAIADTSAEVIHVDNLGAAGNTGAGPKDFIMYQDGSFDAFCII